MKNAPQILLITIVVLVVGIIVTGIVMFAPSKDEPVFCTMEAKLCPDGSAVGRVGPNCEFAPCP